ncbi:type II toxin-antitoxin system death-on-curing family toxin [Rhizobium ruizarguesonis]|uniref:Type II toxin-antitoxin system death-on-curing family toxin n=1 Tax=Rhizobium ruizarguesonis TaxID=2081791 RepID=A0AAE4Z0S3_9HYPH|nr:type II toxin-antitoxin system death-on-curing family toxin [Rhizobium ruizarguesonis]MCB2406296.1 type II toxin-antitoxin system death-on-curing family toxin [Rhizobium ruizarguesonis]NEI53243.1 type II toxin-antitoxin system death-on-curing family toxin [Rhizobium ruizarguesonis]
MSVEPLWVTVDEAILLNQVIVQSTGETHFVRDEGALESALNRPRSYFDYHDVHEVAALAAQLILAVGKAHAFEQGNKRTAWAAGRLFIRNNGYRLKVENMPQIAIAGIVEHMMVDATQITRLISSLRHNIEPI